MESLVNLIIYIVIFAIVVYGLLYICDHFGLPQPVKWIVGALLLIIVLLFLSRELGSGSVAWPRMK